MKIRNLRSLFLGLVFVGVFAHASWKHESEASIVQVGGNTTSESYSAKQKTSYKMELNTATVAGRYLQSKSQSIETAKQWEASVRYERELSGLWSAFLQHGAESDVYAGYLQRDNTDLGAKYYIEKTDEVNFFAELGLRTTQTIPSTNAQTETFSSGRVFTEYSKKFNQSVTGKFWVEYLPNFKDSDNYFLNYEPSMSVMMSEIFSVKVAYLVKYQNKKALPTEKKEDTTFTTALVAKF